HLGVSFRAEEVFAQVRLFQHDRVGELLVFGQVADKLDDGRHVVRRRGSDHGPFRFTRNSSKSAASCGVRLLIWPSGMSDSREGVTDSTFSAANVCSLFSASRMTTCLSSRLTSNPVAVFSSFVRTRYAANCGSTRADG